MTVFVQLVAHAAIAEHYETRTFLLDSGKVQTGIVAFRDEYEVVVRDSAQLGKEVRLGVEDIEEELPAKSLMPAGLADQLQSRSEFLDLAKFISVLGKPGEYANDESPVIRKWRVISSSEPGDLPDDQADWLPAYSKVSGELPPEEYPDGESVFTRGFVNVLVAGRARLEVNSVDGLTLWVDGKPINDLSAPFSLDKGHRTWAGTSTPFAKVARNRKTQRPSRTIGQSGFRVVRLIEASITTSVMERSTFRRIVGSRKIGS